MHGMSVPPPHPPPRPPPPPPLQEKKTGEKIKMSSVEPPIQHAKR